METSDIENLGIEYEYMDAFGHRKMADAQAVAIVEGVMRGQAGSRLKINQQAVFVAREGESHRLTFDDILCPAQWRLHDASGHCLANGQMSEATLPLPAGLPAGEFSLDVTDPSGKTSRLLILSTPRRTFQGAFDRVWLLAIQLYSMRSARNWGIGDFTDLQDAIAWAHELGASGVGVNPLHALFDDLPDDASPYSPNSRLFLNFIYIDVESVPEFDRESFFASKEQHDTLYRVQSSELVDYSQVAALKLAALRAAFGKLESHPARRGAFNAFRRESGKLLSRFACFETLRHRLRQPWWTWDEDFRTPGGAGLTGFGQEHAREVRFIEYVQWIAAEQLQRCTSRSQSLGLSVGLYLDIAVGVRPDGFDAWSEQEAISRDLIVGAPPDLLNRGGQKWGLSGFSPAGLQAAHFRPFRDMLSANMKYAGAIRIDHVLGLRRLYLIPADMTADRGVYVRYPFEAMAAVIAQESASYRCLVIGEDLGTVPDGFREALNDWGIWSYRVVLFERYADGSFVPADRYPRMSLATFNTHDLSPFAAWVEASDIEMKRKMNIDPGETDAERRASIETLARALGVSSNGITLVDVSRFLARSSAQVVSISLEDFLGVTDAFNIPGTVDEHPNWRRKLPRSLNDVRSDHGGDMDRLRDAMIR